MGFSHQNFAELIGRVAPELTPGESLAVRAVAWHETNYGSGWRTPEALASRNLGAITRSPVTKLDDGSVICEPPNFAHGDSLRDPTTGKVVKYQTCFAGYENFEAAAEDLIREVLKANVRSFANRGSLRGVAKAMRKNRYYLGTAPTEAEQVEAYYQALLNAVGDITEATGEPNPFEAGASAAVLLPSPSVSQPSSVPLLSDVVRAEKSTPPAHDTAERFRRLSQRATKVRTAKPLEPSPAAREAMRRLAAVYLQNVPPAYLHMAIALRNLSRFSQEELRAELERRDEQPAFPDPTKLQEELDELEERALDEAAAALESDDLDPFEGEDDPPSERVESTVPPPSGPEPVTSPDTPSALEKESSE